MMTLKESVQRSHRLEKILANHISDEELALRLYKEPSKFNKKNKLSNKKWVKAHEKMFNSISYQENAN